jgi:desulfoferrodoxin (superoxide reductase-like protein)
MTYQAKVAVCSEIRIKHSMQREHHVEFFKVEPGGT